MAIKSSQIQVIMIDTINGADQIQYVNNFNDLLSLSFCGKVNAMCWRRKLNGDFAEIVQKVEFSGNMLELGQDELFALQLSEAGTLAREILLNDLKTLKEQGASPILNVIKHYERDESFPFFPTDVYSFHVDRSPIPTATILCTYHGEASEILPNSQAVQKVLVPEIRSELMKLYGGSEAGFESFLEENFFDLHYQAYSNAEPINLGQGHLWKLAIDHPGMEVLPCLHRAPHEKSGQNRLMMIC